MLILKLNPFHATGLFLFRVQIIVSHFASWEVNSSYCNCEVVIHEKNAKQFFHQEKFNSSTLYFSTLYPHFTFPFHTIFIRNIPYTQNYIAKCKKCFSSLKRKLLPVAETSKKGCLMFPGSK